MQTNFTRAKWVDGANVYEVNVRQYTTQGTFNAFAKHLPRLKKMGVEVLWFMPITPISQVKRFGSLGSYYAASDYTKVNPEFGTLEDFKNLVAASHEAGMKVIIDWVANHTGHDHVWTKEHPEFYKTDADGNFYDDHGWDDVIDLDYTNKSLRAGMLSCMQFWLNTCDIDGFRCDMAHLVPLDFWEIARAEMERIKPGLFWMGETEDENYKFVFDAIYGWKLLHAMEGFYKGTSPIGNLYEALSAYAAGSASEALHLTFTSNHDENSHSGSEYERMGDAARAFAVLAATWPNSLPLVYSGQELPNTKRLLFFDKDAIDWSGDIWLQGFYSSLLTARRKHPALHSNTQGRTVAVKTSAGDDILAYLRTHEGDFVLVMMNLSAKPFVKFTIDEDLPGSKVYSILSGLPYEFAPSQQFEMKRWDYLVYGKAD